MRTLATSLYANDLHRINAKNQLSGLWKNEGNGFSLVQEDGVKSAKQGNPDSSTAEDDVNESDASELYKVSFLFYFLLSTIYIRMEPC